MRKIMINNISKRKIYDVINHYHSLIVIIFFCMLFIIGIAIYKDYGISFDEPVSRDNGGISLKYVLEKFKPSLVESDEELSKYKVSLDAYRDRDYGVSFDMTAFAIERLLKINDSRDQYLLRHLLTFFVYFLSVIALYKIINKQYSDWKWSLLSVILYVLGPRTFAEAFYNNKDIVFMSICVISSYTLLRFLDSTTFKNAILHAFVSAMAIDIRIVGIVFSLLTLFFFIAGNFFTKKYNFKQFAYLIIYFIVLVLFVILFWPWLWEDPINRFSIALKNMTHFRWQNYNLFLGSYVSAQNLPWNYVFIWLIITVPITYTVLALIGCVTFFWRCLVERFSRDLINKNKTSLLFFAILIGPTSFAAIFGSTIYDGWRQFYFIYPSIIVLAVAGIYAILQKANSSFVKIVLKMLLAFQMISSVHWMILNHPFQNVYFNFLATSEWAKRYEGDYWGLTNYRGLTYILEHDPSASIKISTLGSTSVMQSFMLLEPKDRKRLSFVSDLNEADYLITNYRFMDRNSNFELGKFWKLFQQTVVDNNVIYSSFQKITY